MNPFAVLGGFASRAAVKKAYTTGSRFARAYVGRQVKTYTKKPTTKLDYAWLAAEAVGWYAVVKPRVNNYFPNKTDTMVNPAYMMEDYYV